MNDRAAAATSAHRAVSFAMPTAATVPAALRPSSVVAALAVGAIRFYRRYLSPLKGFRCAHHALHGCGSCSDYGLRVFGRRPFGQAVALLRGRLRQCKAAHGALLAMPMIAVTSGTGGSDADDEQRKGRRKRGFLDWVFCMPDPTDLAIGACDIGACDCSIF